MNRVALTFDDGPGPETADLVRFLVDEQAAATFFVLGQNCERRPEVVTMMRDAPGIELATHSYSHPDLHHLGDGLFQRPHPDARQFQHLLARLGCHGTPH